MESAEKEAPTLGRDEVTPTARDDTAAGTAPAEEEHWPPAVAIGKHREAADSGTDQPTVGPVDLATGRPDEDQPPTAQGAPTTEVTEPDTEQTTDQPEQVAAEGEPTAERPRSGKRRRGGRNRKRSTGGAERRDEMSSPAETRDQDSPAVARSGEERTPEPSPATREPTAPNGAQTETAVAETSGSKSEPPRRDEQDRPEAITAQPVTGHDSQEERPKPDQAAPRPIAASESADSTAPSLDKANP